MKRFIGYAVMLTVLVGLMWVWSFGRSGGEQPRCTTTNPRFFSADADGSGTLDINDPVVILNYLFLGGPPPVCLGEPDCGNTTLEAVCVELKELKRALEAPRTFVSVELNTEQQQIPRCTTSSGCPHTLVLFDKVIADQLEEFDISEHKFKAKESGLYLVNSYLSWRQLSNPSSQHIYIEVNGILVNDSISMSNGVAMTSNGSAIIALKSGDKVSIHVSHWSVDNNPDLTTANLQITRIP